MKSTASDGTRLLAALLGYVAAAGVWFNGVTQ
jgi:hypothetical protein